jgi:hypothetical protein
MSLLFTLILLSISFYFGVVCLREPITIVKILALYAQLIFGKHLSHRNSNSRLKEALMLIKDNPTEYQKRFSFQMMMVRQTGFAALFVSIVGTCILILSKI